MLYEFSSRWFRPTASIIIQQGTLKIGDNLYGNASWARVRAMRNEAGKPVKLVTPGMPVFTMGWKQLPDPGEVIVQEKKPDYSPLTMEDTSTNDQQTQSKPDDNFITVPVIVKGLLITYLLIPCIFCCVAR